MIRVKIEWTYPVVPNVTEIQIGGQTGITFGSIRVLSQVLDEILISSKTTVRKRRPFDWFRGQRAQGNVDIGYIRFSGFS